MAPSPALHATAPRRPSLPRLVRRIDELRGPLHAGGCDSQPGDECVSSLEIARLEYRSKQSRWVAEWHNTIVPNPAAVNASRFKLRLALYTPHGIYLYRHDLKFGVAQQASPDSDRRLPSHSKSQLSLHSKSQLDLSKLLPVALTLPHP